MSNSNLPLHAPEPLGADHDVAAFSSGEPSLDAWLKRRAAANQVSGASRTFVLCRGRKVVGYYALAAGAVDHAQASRRLRQNMPDPIPVIVLGRLAIDQSEQRQGLGQALLRDAVLRVASAAETIGVAALLVHALNERAKRFYEDFGFSVSPISPMTLMLRIADIEAALKTSEG